MAGLALMGLLVMLTAGQVQANMIQNGSFEVHTHTPNASQKAANSELGDHTYAGSDEWGGTWSVTGWTKTGSRLWYVTDGTDNEFPDGAFAFRIDARLDLEGANKLQQSGIALSAGTQYDFSFDLWGASGNAIVDVELTGPATIKVFDNASSSGTDGNYETKSTQFTPNVTGSYTISFFTDPHNGDNHAWIDNAILVPEPGTLAIVAVGLLGLRRRRRA